MNQWKIRPRAAGDTITIILSDTLYLHVCFLFLNCVLADAKLQSDDDVLAEYALNINGMSDQI